MSSLLLFVLIICFYTIYAQSLHHEMISTQGGGIVTNFGNKVNYTVGQQSVIVSTSVVYVVQRGFQINNWSKIKNDTNSIQTTLFPNPFVAQMTFTFPSSLGAKINAMVFDIIGRLVHSEVVVNENNKIKLNLSRISIAEYLIRFTSGKFQNATKIVIK